MALSQAQINANRKKLKLNPLIKTENKGGALIPTEIKKKPKVELGGFTDKPITAPDVGITSGIPRQIEAETTDPIPEVDPAKSPTEKVEDIAKRLGVNVDLSQSGREETFKRQAAEAETQLEQSIRLQQEARAAEAKQKEEQLSRFEAAAKSGLAEGPEGVQTGAAGLQAGFSRGVQNQRDALQRESEGFSQQVGNLRAQLRSAKESGAVSLASSIQSEITAAENEQKRIDFALAQQEQDQLNEQKKGAQAQLDFLTQLPPTAFAAMPTAQLEASFEAAGLPAFMGGALKNAQAELAEAQKSKDEIAIKQAQADLDKTIQQGQQAAQSETQKAIEGFQTLQNALADGKITQDAFDSLSQEMGFAKEEVDPLDKQIKQAQLNLANSKTSGERIANQQALQDLEDQQALAGDGINIIGTTSQIPTGTESTAEDIYSTYGLPRLGRQDMKGECGAFVNDVLGMASTYGDTYESKFKNVNNFNPLNPTAGSVFVSNLGNEVNGHTGFVESVNGNGTVTLVDMNRYGDRKFNRRNVLISDLPTKEGITGYQNVATSKKNKNPKAGEYTQLVNTNIESGMDEEDAKKLAYTQIAEAAKDMTETEAKSFTAYNTVVAENKIYDEIQQNIDPESFADGINVLTRIAKSSENQISAEIVNRNIKDDTVKRAISSELRWINSVLRKESGAAIAFTEYIDKGNGWFPRAGDSPAQLKDKENARRREEQNLYATMGSKGQKLTQDANTTELRNVTDNTEKTAIRAKIQGFIEATDGEGNPLYSLKDIEDTLVSEGINPKQFLNTTR